MVFLKFALLNKYLGIPKQVNNILRCSISLVNSKFQTDIALCVPKRIFDADLKCLNNLLLLLISPEKAFNRVPTISSL